MSEARDPGMGAAVDRPSSTVGRLVREIYFPTYVYFKDLSCAVALNAALSAEIRSIRSADPEGVVRSNMKQAGSWHSALDLHERPSFEPLVAEVLGAARGIGEDLEFDPAYPFVVDNMWTIINPRHGSNRSHIHPRVQLSGVYYIQAPPQCGRICFADPRMQAQILPPRLSAAGRARPHNWSEVAFEPIAGRLILFPSWLAHEVEPNLTTLDGEAGERIIVSFNLYQDASGTVAAAASDGAGPATR